MTKRQLYHVIRAYTLAKLEAEVSNYLNDGWSTTGGVSSSRDEDGMKFYMQAMTSNKTNVTSA